MSYCNARATRLLHQADRTLNPKARQDLVNQADGLMANDIPTIPLYQKPTYLVFHNYVKGIRDNVAVGPTYNVEDWWMDK